MRTTITIDDDVAPRVEDEMRRSRSSFKETINRLLRLGLTVQGGLTKPGKFKVRTRPLDALPGFDFDNIGEVLERIEGSENR